MIFSRSALWMGTSSKLGVARRSLITSLSNFSPATFAIPGLLKTDSRFIVAQATSYKLWEHKRRNQLKFCNRAAPATSFESWDDFWRRTYPERRWTWDQIPQQRCRLRRLMLFQRQACNIRLVGE